MTLSKVDRLNWIGVLYATFLNTKMVNCDFAVCLLMLSFGWGYRLEGEFSGLIEMEPPKKWLVFIEMRILRCMRHTLRAQLYSSNTLNFFRCITHTQNLTMTCVVYNRRLYLATKGNDVDLIVYPSILQEQDPKCLQKTIGSRKLNFGIFIHKLFDINLTIANFYHEGGRQMQPVNGNCQGFLTKFSVSYDNCTDTFCGKRFPWIIYTNSYKAALLLSPIFFYESTHIVVKVSPVDKHFINSYCAVHSIGQQMDWGVYSVYTYHIRAEMLYNLFISLESVLTQGSGIFIYNGPAQMMPQLVPYKNVSGKIIYRTSTFQAFVIAVSATKSATSRLIYNIDQTQVLATKSLTLNQQIVITNNSGCGNMDISSWMCTLHIVSPISTHASLQILNPRFRGPFDNMHISIGIAVYNILENESNLVAHFYTSQAVLQKNVTIISTENKLLVTFYAYSPFTLLSSVVIANSNPCMGLFVGWYIRPSIALMPYNVTETTNYLGYHALSSNIYLNISAQCVVIHIIFIPNEYFEYHSISIIFEYHIMTSIHLESSVHDIPPLWWNCHKNVMDGDFSYTHLSPYSVSGSRSFKSIGVIKQIDMEIFNCGNRPFTIVSVFDISCMYPCRDLYKDSSGEKVSILKCDICKYKWLSIIHNGQWYLVSSGINAVSDHMNGGRVMKFLLSSPISNTTPVDHYVIYSTHKTPNHFNESRLMMARFEREEQVWRVPRESLKFMTKNEVSQVLISTHFIRINATTFRRGGYEYLVLGFFAENWTAGDVECRKRGAYLLTVYDDRELHFVLNNIMRPLNLEHVFVGMKRMVR